MSGYQPKDLNKFAEDIPVLEILLRDKGHLRGRLLALINHDTAMLAETGINPEQIFAFFQLMRHVEACKLRDIDPVISTKIILFTRARLPSICSTWCLYSTEWRCIRYNGCEFIIMCLRWTNVENCPILQYYTQDNYDVGDRDWFIYRCDDGRIMHIPDLVPLQIANYGFAQDGVWRVDPANLVRFLGMINTDHMPVLKREIYWYIYHTDNREIKSDDIIYHENDHFTAVKIRDNEYFICPKENCQLNFIFKGISGTFLMEGSRQFIILKNITTYRHTLGDKLIVM